MPAPRTVRAVSTRTVVMAESELRCYAPHPLGMRIPRFAGRECRKRQGPVLPVLFHRTGRTWRKEEEGGGGPQRVPGFAYTECSCGWVSEYEIVAPEQTASEAA